MKLDFKDFIPVYGGFIFFKKFFATLEPTETDKQVALTMHYYHLYSGFFASILLIILGVKIFT